MSDTRLDASKKAIALGLLESFKKSGMTITNQGVTLPLKEFCDLRRQGIGEIREMLTAFLEGKIGLSDFRDESTRLSLKHNYWGFTGFSGQMTLNQLVKWTNGSVAMEKLLRKVLGLPKKRDDARVQITSCVEQVPDLLPKDKRIRFSSIPFVLSYYWQVQDPLNVPVQYTSSTKALEETGLLAFEGTLGDYFMARWGVHDELARLYDDEIARIKEIHYWFVEFVLYRYIHSEEAQKRQEAKVGERKGRASTRLSERSLGEATSYIPPVVADLPALSVRDGENVAFEEKVAELFAMLGFQVERMGQGKGRAPDGIAKCREFNYAVIYDAKAYSGGYSIGRDDRKVIEYIKTNQRELQREGYSNIYFAFISGSFTGDPKGAIDRIRKETSAKSVVMVPVDQALRILARRIREPYSFSLEGFENLFLDNGPLQEGRVDEFLDS